MRLGLIIVAMSMCLLSIAGATAAEPAATLQKQPAAEQSHPLVGEWQAFEGTSQGKPVSEKQIREFRVVVNETEWREIEHGSKVTVYSYQIDATGKFPRLTIYRGKDKQKPEALAIYRLSGDGQDLELCIANNKPNATFPETFESTGQNGFDLIKLKRHAQVKNDEAETSKAVAELQQVLARNPNDPDAHLKLGNALRQLGRSEEATGHYQEALRLKPGSTDAHLSLGRTLRDLGRINEAIAHYQQALTLNPKCPGAFNSLGIALAQRGSLEEAQSCFEMEVKNFPDNAAAKENLRQLKEHIATSANKAKPKVEPKE